MIPVRGFEGRTLAVFGLARTGLTAARALLLGGAKVVVWDDKAESREAARAGGFDLVDLSTADWSQFAAPAVFGAAMRLYASSRLTEARPVHNLVVSNVPGPQVPLYFLGSEVKAMYPLGPIFHGSGLNITVMSLSGKLDVGLISCPELLPDLWSMADDFAVGMEELLAACNR